MSVNKVILMGNVGKTRGIKISTTAVRLRNSRWRQLTEHLKRQMVQKYRSAPNGTILFCKMDWQRLQKSM